MARERMYHLGKDESKEFPYRITLGSMGTLVSKHRKSRNARQRIRELAQKNDRDFRIHL